MNKTGIEYLDYSWNPIAMRCTPVSEGCTNCWHRRMADRLAGNESLHFDVRRAYAGEGPPVLVEERLMEPVKRKKAARIGVQFMGDLFHERIDIQSRRYIFDVMVGCKWHTFLVLTKRPRNVMAFWHHYSTKVLIGTPDGLRYEKRDGVLDWPSHIQLGVSVENQATADERREYLRQTPAATKFVSYEPALGPVDWTGWEFVDRIISGGESGPKARPSHPDWHRATRGFCQKHGIAYFMKQWGAWIPQILFPDIVPSPDGWGTLDGEGNWFPLTTPWNGRQGEESPEKEYVMIRVGKKAAGRLLDGQLWEEVLE